MFIATITFSLLLALTAILYKLSIRNYNYWKNKNVPHPKPLPLVGNFLEVFTFRCTFGHYLARLYNELKAPYFGIYILNSPSIVITDPDLIKTILTTHYSYFPDRNAVSDEKCDPVISYSLAFVKCPAWKSVRAKVSPAFSVSKIKGMVYLIDDVADEMVNYIKNNAKYGSLDAKDVTAKYSTDVIATCAFGVKAHCFQDENAEFKKIGSKMFGFSWRNAIVQPCYFMAPSVVKLLKLPFFHPKVYEFTRRVYWDAVEDRKKSKVKRHDLIDAIHETKSTSADDFVLEGDRAVGQAVLFYAAGFESSSSAVSFTLYELCLNKNIQDKLRKEIKMVLSMHKKITYEALQDMIYMEMVVHETLRKYPPFPFLDRTCAKDYIIPNTNVVIEKGTALFIPILGLHSDPKFYPDPDRYDPERFADKSSESYSYLPFGGGPRTCVGAKFGVTSTKVALARILAEFEVELTEKTAVPIEFETTTFLLAPKGGLPIRFKVVND